MNKTNFRFVSLIINFSEKKLYFTKNKNFVQILFCYLSCCEYDVLLHKCGLRKENLCAEYISLF